MGYNTKAIVLAGLHNDYNGVFNLSEDTAYDNISVDVITNGDEYVENTEASYMHAGDSSIKESETILPIYEDNTLPLYGDNGENNYGSVLTTLISNYINIKEVLEGKVDIYEDAEAYKNYKNQFYVQFKDTGTLIENNDAVYAKLSYINYKGEEVSFIGKSFKTYTLDNITNTGFYFNTTIVHFSKYYNLYSMNTGLVKTLRPLISSPDDLDKYGLGVTSITEDGVTKSIPYVKYLLATEFYRYDDCDWTTCRYEKAYHGLWLYDTSSNTYKYANNFFGYRDDGTGTATDYSMFKTNPEHRNSFPGLGDWDMCPSGFMLYTFYDEKGGSIWYNPVEYYIDPKNTGGDTYRNTSLPLSFRKNFKHSNQTLNFTDKCLSLQNGNIFVGFVYRSDSEGNLRIFNSYFPVNVTLNSGVNSLLISPIINYVTNDVAKIRPKYIGLILASILSSIYIYGNDEGATANYISDCVYLTDNYTTYTKDIIYRMYVNNETTPHNNLILFHRIPFSEYINNLKTHIDTNKEDKDGKFNDNNVTLNLKGGIKNVPILYVMNYIEPDTSAVGVQATAKVKLLDGTSVDTSVDGLVQNDLYQIDKNGLVTRLSGNFSIKWVDTLEADDASGTLTGGYYKTVPRTENGYIYKMFKYSNEVLDFKDVQAISTKSGDYYSVYSDHKSLGSWYGNTFYDLPVNDILVPYARIV